MDTGTQQRVLARVAASAVEAMAVWKTVYELVFAETQSMWAALIIATIIMLICLGVDIVTTYYNNDFTEEGVIGTAVTRRLKEHPELGVMVDVEDPEEDDDAEEVIEGEE
jgi:L-asparagine transporter-like permease